MFYVVLITGIIVDLYTKHLAGTYLKEKINIIGDFLYFQYVENSGIAFSISIPLFILKILTIILIIGILCYYLKEEAKKKNLIIDLSFGLILAGAIGNGIERIFNEKVIDFIGVNYFSIFNLADSFISIGAFLYIFYSLFSKK